MGSSYKGLQTKLRLKINQLNYLLLSHSPLHIKRLLYTLAAQSGVLLPTQIYKTEYYTLFQELHGMSELTLHADLKLPFVSGVLQTKYTKFFDTFQEHTNQLINTFHELAEAPHQSSSFNHYCLLECYWTGAFPQVPSYSCIYFTFAITLDCVFTQKVSFIILKNSGSSTKNVSTHTRKKVRY